MLESSAELQQSYVHMCEMKTKAMTAHWWKILCKQIEKKTAGRKRARKSGIGNKKEEER